MKYLKNLKSVSDIRSLSKDELNELCSELRAEIVRTTSENGGHVASNLGVVELTVALHLVFNTKWDRLVFDVGHQCYAHKLLTGRYDRFSTLRTLDGISGFPDPEESKHDAFRAGHASTAISAALGMARARTLKNENYSVVALLGDGALTGGMAYEALSDAGQSKERIIVILNDNEMSIGKNVGGVAELLGLLRLKPGYTKLKTKLKRIVGDYTRAYRLLAKIRDAMKHKLLRNNTFEAMGFTYIGPVDGHNIDKLVDIFTLSKSYERPVFVHVRTKKGMGYSFAETNPEKFHGPSGFNISSGEIPAGGESFSQIFGDSLCEYAESDSRVCGITAAMRGGTGLDKFAGKFPDRFFDVGIAEEHAATMAAGMAAEGMRPVFAVYSTFAQRCYDQMIHDAALQKLPVIYALDRAGLVGRDGATHQGVFDVGFLSQIPGMTIYSPSSHAELHDMLGEAFKHDSGPVAIRYPRGKEGEYKGSSVGSSDLLVSGSDVTIAAYGMMINEALKAAKELLHAGIFAEVIKLNTLKPLDYDAIADSAVRTGGLIVVEDCVKNGSAGISLAAELEIRRIPVELKLLNLGDKFIEHGGVEELMRLYKIDAYSIVLSAKEIFSEKTKVRPAIS